MMAKKRRSLGESSAATRWGQAEQEWASPTPAAQCVACRLICAVYLYGISQPYKCKGIQYSRRTVCLRQWRWMGIFHVPTCQTDIRFVSAGSKRKSVIGLGRVGVGVSCASRKVSLTTVVSIRKLVFVSRLKVGINCGQRYHSKDCIVSGMGWVSL
eukprot:scaffold190573_cov21-Tisochrysis_lutea.AAC.1